jgi:hypothetical protein
MASKDIAAISTTDITTKASDSWGDEVWETQVEEIGSKVEFENPGDTLRGIYLGAREVDHEGDTFTVLSFRGPDGVLYETNAGWKLREGFADIAPGTKCQLIFTKWVQTGQPSPLKDYRIDVAV